MFQNEQHIKWKRRNWLRLSLSAIAAGIITGFTKRGKYGGCIPTPIQEAGPFPVMKFRNQADHDINLVQIKGNTKAATGQVIIVTGIVQDADCNPVHGAVVEIWQANHVGKYRHELQDNGSSDPNFQGWGQAVTNKKGLYRFTTILPGLYGSRARHIHFKVARRGYHELVTQMYFEGDERQKNDFVLNQLTHKEQVMLIVTPVESEGIPTFNFNIHLEKIDTGKVSEKLLKEYTGNYILSEDHFGFKQFLKTATGNDWDITSAQLYHKEGQLFLSFPFFIPVEMGWSSKDEFQSWAFFNSFIRFQRDVAGKVSGFHLHLSEDQFAAYRR